MAGFEYADAAHLLRRMGFGGNPDEISALAARGREGAVDYLLAFEAVDNSEMERIVNQSFTFLDGDEKKELNTNELQSWWMTRLVLTKRPFEEKMTLFWHNHFATALTKAKDFYMYGQNVTLRKNVLGRFDDLLLKISQDPAMLLWLDGVTNVKDSPNENFGRELQELFTMGIRDVVTGQANYTETDVKEIARAFTGWSFRRDRQSDSVFDYVSFVDPNQHDAGAKTIYGQTANFDGADVISVIAARRATGRFLVYKLFTFFVYPLDISSAADQATIDKFADVYVSGNHSIKALMRAIFVSDEFFSARARFALVKTPVELIVGAVRMLRANYLPGTSERGQREVQLIKRATDMGMMLFNPPDVAGWDLNLGWVNTATMLERYNYANFLLTNRPRAGATDGVWITNEQLMAYVKPAVKKTVGKFLEVLGPLEVSPATNKQLRKYLTTDDQGNSIDWVVNDQTVDKKVRGLVHQIMSLPEFQMS